MIRDINGRPAYWDARVSFYKRDTAKMWQRIKEPFVDPSYRAQYVFELAKNHWQLMFCRYSRGDAIGELAQHFGPLLDAWEESIRLGRDVYTAEQQYTRRAWAVNFDHYVVCFWLIGLALTLNIADDHWQRLLALVGNEGEDILLDRVIASRSPGRRIGTSLCFQKPYARLLAAIDSPSAEQSKKLREFVDHWYGEMAVIGKSGRAKQVVPYPHPYWHKLGDENFEGGAYFGRWCIEAVAAVKAFDLDDSLCLGHEHYPGDLLRPAGPSTHALRAEPARGLFARLFGKSE